MMASPSERRRGKRAYEREEHLHFWEYERMEHPRPPLFDLHPQLDTLRKHMEDALHEAIEDANAPRMRYRATDGELRSERGESYRYTFRFQTFWEPQDETPVKIQIDPHHPERVIDGTVIETDGTVLHLATEVPLPSSALSLLLLYEDTSWLLQQLLSAITPLRETSAHMGAKTFGLIDGIDEETGKGRMQTSIGTFTPDEDQQQALWRGRFCEILRLIGPPGTGKTRTLTALAWYYLRQGMTVLLLSHTNVAVDNAVMSLQALCQQTEHVGWISEHRIVRVGNGRDLDAERYQDIIHTSIVDQELGGFAQERDALKMEDRTLLSEKAALEQTHIQKQQQWTLLRLPLVQRFKEAEQELKEVEDRIDAELVTLGQEVKEQQQKQIETQQTLKPLKEEEQRLVKRRSLLQQEQHEDRDERIGVQAGIETVEAMKPFVRFFSVRHQHYDLAEEKQRLNRLNGDIARAKQEIEHIDEALAKIARQKIGPELAVEQAKKQEAKLHQILIEHPSPSDQDRRSQLEQARNQVTAALNQGDAEIHGIEQRIEAIHRRRDEIKDRLEDIEREQRQVKARVASEADLIATTLTSVYTSPYLKGRYFDCVILDEASMAPLPAVLVAATRATQHVAVIGDPLQFAPIAGLHHAQKYPKAAQWLGTDLFSYLKITVEQASHGEKQAVFLSQQSRMDPDIARAVSQYIYQGQLKNRERPGYVRSASDPLSESAWIVVDTSDAPLAECGTQRPANGKSKFNDYHVQCVVRLVSVIIASGALPHESGQPRIGIVTPYAPQARKIREALQQQGLDHHARVGTVFAFQGREFEMVIVDLVESPGTPIPRFTSDIWGRDDVATPATRLINVAHSRARSKLIYVTNVEYHRRQSGKNHVLLQFINDAVASGRLASHDLLHREEAVMGPSDCE